jgi:hypothetical protein
MPRTAPSAWRWSTRDMTRNGKGPRRAPRRNASRPFPALDAGRIDAGDLHDGVPPISVMPALPWYRPTRLEHRNQHSARPRPCAEAGAVKRGDRNPPTMAFRGAFSPRPRPLLRKLGRRFRALREARDLTQEELGASRVRSRSSPPRQSPGRVSPRRRRRRTREASPGCPVRRGDHPRPRRLRDLDRERSDGARAAVDEHGLVRRGRGACAPPLVGGPSRERNRRERRGGLCATIAAGTTPYSA